MTANNSDDSTADGVEGDHGGQHECQVDHECAALPVAMSLSEHNPRVHHYARARDRQVTWQQGHLAVFP